MAGSTKGRKGLSLKPEVYLRLREIARLYHTTPSRIVEDLILREARSNCVPKVTRDEAQAVLAAETKTRQGERLLREVERHANSFTF